MYSDAVTGKINSAVRDIESIRATGGKYTAALLERFMSTLSMEGLAEYRASLEKAE